MKKLFLVLLSLVILLGGCTNDTGGLGSASSPLNVDTPNSEVVIIGSANITIQTSGGNSTITGTTNTTLTGLLKGDGSVISAVSAPTGVVVGNSDTQELTNKTYTGGEIGSTFILVDGAGRAVQFAGTLSTAQIALSLSPTYAIADNNERINFETTPIFYKTGSDFTSHSIGYLARAYLGASNTSNWTSVLGLVGSEPSVQILSGASGTINNITGQYVRPAWIDSTNVTVTEGKGIWIREPEGAGTPSRLGNWYSLYIADPSNKSTGVNYAIYSPDSNNYFGGIMLPISGLLVSNSGVLEAATADNVTSTLGYTPQEELVSGVNIKTINGDSILGAGDLAVAGGSGNTTYYITTATYTCSSATPTTISECDMPIVPNCAYIYSGVLSVITSADLSGLGLSFIATGSLAGASSNFYNLTFRHNASSVGTANSGYSTSNATATYTSQFPTPVVTLPVEFSGYFIAGASNYGTLSLGFRPEVSTNMTTVYPNSYISINRIK